MLRRTKAKQKTVAEKVSELITRASGSDSDSDEATAPRVVDFDEDYELPEARTTEFRKRNVKLLSEQSSKYKGKIAARKDFEEDEVSEDNDESDMGSTDDEEALKKFGAALEGKNLEYDETESDDQEESDAVENTDEEEEDEESDDDDDDDGEENDDEETEVISKVNRDAEIQKGLCVQNQLQLWERFLEMRINAQKILTKANQLPPATAIKELESENDKNKTVIQDVSKQVHILLQSLLNLQDTLYGQYSEVRESVKPTLKRPSPFKQNNSKDEPPLKQINSYLQDRFDSFKSYRNAVLLKWDDRTRLLQPGAGVKKRSMNEEYDIIKKIDNTLMNKSMLVQKSQQQKNNTTSKNVEDIENLEDVIAANVNIYDDSDFYHQQLRELIEYKANTSNNMSEVTKQFLELQKLRQKMKKKVDTRASKGRKLR